MPWVDAIFDNGNGPREVLAQVGEDGQLVVENGRVPHRYPGNPRIYQGARRNITLVNDGAGGNGQPPTEDEPQADPHTPATQTTTVDFSTRTIDWAIPSGFQQERRIFLQSSGRLDPVVSEHLPRWTHACVCYGQDIVSEVRLTPEQRTALYIAERILGRGYAPPVDPVCREEILASVGEPGGPRSTEVSWESPDGSEEEELFLQLMMDDQLCPPEWLPHLHLQVPFHHLVAGAGEFRRVDFALYPPSGRGQAIVIEIDGGQHQTPAQQEVDQERDNRLHTAGHRVLRFTTEQVREQAPNIGEEIRSHLSEFNLGSTTEDGAVAAGQVARAAVELVRLGVLPADQDVWRVRTKGSHGVAIAAGLRMVQRMLDALGPLYRAAVGPKKLDIGPSVAEPDIILSWSADEPWFGAVQTVEDGVPLVSIRPTYLPGWSRLNLPTQEWVGPDPLVDVSHLTTLLRCVFPKNLEFWQGQEAAIRRILGGEDTLVLLPTGGGKSLVYQLSGLLVQGLCLVVSPLVALMEDQLDNLFRAGFERCAVISSNTTDAGQTKNIQKQLASGAYVLCYVSPERLQIQDFRDALSAVSLQMPVPAIIVDEAHCVSEWGHTFRTSYLTLGRTGRRIGRRSHGVQPAVVGLTGTASRNVLRDVQRELDIRGIDAVMQ